ncbi:MAG: FliH/SctL family protein [Dethiobacteria bacterium]
MTSNILKGVSVKGIRTYRFHIEVIDQEEFTAGEGIPDEKEREDPVLEPQTQTAVDDSKETIRLELENIEKLREETQAELSRLKTALLEEVEEFKAKAIKEGREEGYEEGYGKGYALGFEEGKKLALQELEDLKEEARDNIKEAQRYVEEARKKSREIVASSEKTVIELAMAVAEKLLFDQLDLAPEKVLNIVREAISKVPDGETVKVFVSGQDYDICLRHGEELKKKFAKIRPNFKSIEFLPVEEMPRGSCRVESESGAVEFFLEKEKEQLREAMMKLAREEERKILKEEGAHE